MATSFTTPALVLRRWKAGESALMVRFLTPGNGLLNASVGGAQKPTGSLHFLGNPFTLAQIEVLPTRGTPKVIQGSPLGTFHGIQDRLPALQAAALVVEAAERSSTEGLANPALFVLTLETLQHFTEAADAELDVPLLRFAWLLLDGLGAAPVLERCIRTGGTDAGAYVVPLVNEGGFACADAARGFPAQARLPVEVLHLLHDLSGQLHESEGLPDLAACDPQLQRMALAVLLHFLQATLHEQLKTAEPYLAGSAPLVLERVAGDLTESA
ncbi:MAG TPA: DNA repair protein RecO [bacterium]|nr:DNA repair protein RecO [bacterium]